MDRVFSARVDEAVVRKVSLLARLLGTSKKAVLERAINELADNVEDAGQQAVLGHTHGVWQRNEDVATTVREAKQAFDSGMKRHQP
jgi:hypothetical protein